MTVWLAKYALSAGVTEHEPTESILGGYVQLPGLVGLYAFGRDVFKTPQEAWAKAEEMRLAKIKSIRKSLAKLEAMHFPPHAKQESSPAIDGAVTARPDETKGVQE